MGISRVFDISRRSLATYQKAIDISSHNIANASNPNYTRQRARISTEIPEKTAQFIWGTGVKLDNIDRVKDGLIEAQLINNSQSYSRHNKESILLGQVEQLFSEPSNLGISNLLTNFMNSWNELSVTPNSVSLRNNVIFNAQNLADKVKNVNTDLDTIKYDVFHEFKEQTDRVNTLLSEINEFNKQIFSFKASTSSPNDLLDERDALINELSGMVNIKVNYDQNNMASVSIGGVFAVDGSFANTFEAQVVNNKLTLVSANNPNPIDLSGGELYSLSDVYSNKISEYQSGIDSIFNKLVEKVNALHESGYSLNDSTQTGIKFFTSYSGGELEINSSIISDPTLISVSSDGTSGNGEIARQISEISNESVLNGQTLLENYASLVSKIGNEKLTNEKLAEANKMVVDNLEMQKASISSVSIDEEMTEIIKFQRSFDASAKLIQIANNMLEQIMGLI
ncbi:MAG: flagellar hook-associated protein FlgK [Ignavibacteriales bacterium CG_4_9_14_3_um_filter_34_10]|nr:MAG: flagellar hook-associated protein FlgK [Ignavibacteriales bacterium CG_4_9_14_3_um_filter_34_10]